MGRLRPRCQNRRRSRTSCRPSLGWGDPGRRAPSPDEQPTSRPGTKRGLRSQARECQSDIAPARPRQEPTARIVPEGHKNCRSRALHMSASVGRLTGPRRSRRGGDPELELDQLMLPGACLDWITIMLYLPNPDWPRVKITSMSKR
mgnify:CR=1 FL=1